MCYVRGSGGLIAGSSSGDPAETIINYSLEINVLHAGLRRINRRILFGRPCGDYSLYYLKVVVRFVLIGIVKTHTICLCHHLPGE